MNLQAVTKKKWIAPAIGVVLTVLCGMLIQETKIGEKWEYISYDSLSQFGFKPVTNKVVLITMDENAYREMGQIRGPGHHWDRALHAQLLNKLAEDHARLVVFDVAFESGSTPDADESLAAAIRRQGHVVLMEKIDEPKGPTDRAYHIRPLFPAFANAAAGIGVGRIFPTGSDQVARQHWPFPSPDQTVVSLPWRAAELTGAHLSPIPVERWIRYYGTRGGWTTFSYPQATNQNPGFFSNKVVFIGQEPAMPKNVVGVDDNFRTPVNSDDVGGVEVLATMYLNLLRGDWLLLIPRRGELLVFAAAGLLLGGGLSLLKRPFAAGAAVLAFFAILITAGCISYFSPYWFDWVGVACGQVPIALGWALVAPGLVKKPIDQGTIVLPPGSRPITQLPNTEKPDAPDYELCDIPFGSGAYGHVWLARNAIGQWQALKAVYLSGFEQNRDPYDREFNGISRYKPVSEKHPGLLRVDFISQKKPQGYFYYVMELGDSLNPGWEKDPQLYRPKDLAALRRNSEGQRLPPRECVRIGLALCEAVGFLHSQGLTHRDIKPGNIIFVNGRPKLADVGLIAEIRPNLSEITWVGTPAYMPPPPETPGTAQADIYGLGMVLYVIRTGRDPEFFPGVATTLAEQGGGPVFLALNRIILKACQPDITQRYATAGEMGADLSQVMNMIDNPGG